MPAHKLRTIIIKLLILLLFPGVAAAATHEYTVHVSEDMGHMTVEARFAHRVRSITARSTDARRYLTDVRDCESGDRIRTRRQRMLLPPGGLHCIRYEVDLGRAAAAERRNELLADSNFIVSPTVWFWRPALQPDDRIAVRFNVDESVRVSVPWAAVPGEPDAFLLQDSPQSSEALAAFGNFRQVERQIPGATLRITALRPQGNMPVDALIDWVASAAGNINLVYGRFPNPETHIMLMPVGRNAWDADAPVAFGRVIRDGGESVELLINESRPIEEFYDDWTATHEFSHLMLPYIATDYRWISEGFASYYQNLLMARAGQYTEQRAWQKLWDGFERGRQSRPELTPNEASREGVRRATMKIYWSGAAIALLADVELRQRSHGSESLDTVLDRLQLCCLPSDRMWSGPEFFRKLDTLVDEPVFMPLYRRYANTTGFPDMRPVLASLGIDVSRSDVRLVEDAELAGVRRAMISAWETPAGH